MQEQNEHRADGECGGQLRPPLVNALPSTDVISEAVNLQVEEAVLKGESGPVENQTAPVDDTHAAVGDQTNMVFAGGGCSTPRGGTAASTRADDETAQSSTDPCTACSRVIVDISRFARA
jgi:hypothetical protein